MPFFSIVIASYNRADYIRATLESLRRQEFKDYEVIVVDDASTDKTLDILRDYPWVKVLQQQNQGPGVARNHGVGESSGEYIAFLDSDDIWFPWTLSTFAAVLERYGQPELVAANLVEFRDEVELEQVNHEELRVEVFKDYYEASHTRYFVGACMMIVRRQAFLDSGGFTSKRIYAEDCDLAIRFGELRGFAQILAPRTLGYRQHSANARKNLDLIFKGILNLIESERAGKYPGGPSRERDRIRLITLHVRPTSLELIYCANLRRAWELYSKTFFWHLKDFKRWKYLMGFPILALAKTCKIWLSHQNAP